MSPSELAYWAPQMPYWVLEKNKHYLPKVTHVAYSVVATAIARGWTTGLKDKTGHAIDWPTRDQWPHWRQKHAGLVLELDHNLWMEEKEKQKQETLQTQTDDPNNPPF